MEYLPTLTYHKNQPNAGKYTSPMDLMGIDAVFPAERIWREPGEVRSLSHDLQDLIPPQCKEKSSINRIKSTNILGT